MSAAKHTPGPWTARAFSSVVGCPITAQPDRTKNTINLAGVYGSQHDSDAERRAEIEANARLIAAAPDLLSAARRALAVLRATGESVRPKNALGALHDAIVKASGEAP